MSKDAPAVTGVAVVAFDAVDPQRLGRFWQALLGGELSIDRDGDASLRTPGGPDLDFFAVPERKSVKNRLHLDLLCSDLGAATEQALALGATLADDVYDGGSWQVLRDPEGNEFCILRPQG